MKTLMIVSAVLIAIISFFYLRLNSQKAVQEVVQEALVVNQTESLKEKIEPFVSELKPNPPKKTESGNLDDSGSCSGTVDDDSIFDSLKLGEDCIDECDKIEKIFNEYWEAKNEYDREKFKLKYEEPFMTDEIDNVEIVLNFNGNQEDLQKALWKSEFFDDDQSSQTKRLVYEIDQLFETVMNFVAIISKVRLMMSGECMPCVLTTAFDSIHDQELKEIKAFQTVLRYARRK